MKNKIITQEATIDSKKISFEVGRFAGQANSSVLARLGDTMILATVVASSPREDLDYFPLFVEYREKFYAGGRIKGSRWVKREGKPSDEAILKARLIDRSIRPLFPEGYRGEVQVVITVLSVDSENDADVLAACAASAALAISDIPWQGPVATVRIGFKDKNFFTNPVYQEREFSELDLIVSGNKEKILMVEAGANEVSEETLIKALKFAQGEIKNIITAIEKLKEAVGQKKQEFVKKEIPSEIREEIKKEVKVYLSSFIESLKEEKGERTNKREILEAIKEKVSQEAKEFVESVFNKAFKEKVRAMILEKKTRVDGRKLDKVRSLSCEVGVLPRTHGSAVFKRGATQALTITTLGSPSLEQWIENMEGEETKRYIHHYFMPPYSIGEVGRFGWPSRREVGHGALAEKALMPLIPAEKKFPYTIRVVSQIMSSNGSTSMASVCGSSLSLMDAGVPLQKPVAGIAMGLINGKGEDYAVLTDIMGLEDHIGDMDFKVAGTKDGITALQLDVKVLGIKPEVLAEGLKQAKEARLFILKEMEKALTVPREKVSQYAPKVSIMQINKEKIGTVIGPGGKMIRQITEETGAAVDIDEEGMVTISGIDQKGIKRAVAWIEGLTREVEVGEEFTGEVKRIQPFGAFVEILPSKDGLVHVSKMSTSYVKDPGDVVKVGDKVKVRVVEVDDRGRINLSMLFGEDAKKAPGRRPAPRRERKFNSPYHKKRF